MTIKQYERKKNFPATFSSPFVEAMMKKPSRKKKEKFGATMEARNRGEV